MVVRKSNWKKVHTISTPELPQVTSVIGVSSGLLEMFSI